MEAFSDQRRTPEPASDAFERAVVHALELYERDGPSGLRAFLAGRADAGRLEARVQRLLDLGLLASPETSAPTRIGRFEVRRRLGRGGMGVVYRVHDPELGRDVALKTFHPAAFPGARERLRLEREVRLVASLQHPAVVRVHAFGSTDGVPWFTMDLVEGCSLAEVLHALRAAGSTPGRARGHELHALAFPEAGPPRGPDVPFRRLALDWALELAEALQHAHAHGVVHRDVKPSNVLVTPDLRPHLVDFGLAWGSDEHTLTRSDELVGTLAYAPPEQLGGAGRAPSAAADVYGLGATLYELLTGVPPHAAPTTAGLLRAILEEEPRPLRAVDRTISRDLESVTLRALRKRPEQRYPDARALAEDLVRVRANRPVAARPAPVAERAWRWLRRRPLVGAVLLLALATAVGLPAVLLRERARALDEADRRAQLTDFLEESFLGADVEELGREATSRELLLHAAGLLDARLGRLPLERERLRTKLAAVLTEFGQRDEAGAMLERAVAELAALPGEPAARELATAHNYLAILHHGGGDVPRALRHYERALTLREAVLGARDAATLQALANLARATADAGRLERAAELYARYHGAAADAAAAGPDAEQRVIVAANHATLLVRLGRTDEAEQRLAEPLAAALAGALDGELCEGLVYDAAGRVAEAHGAPARALELQTRAVEVYRALLGPGSLYASIAGKRLGGLVLAAGRPAEAEEHLRAARAGLLAAGWDAEHAEVRELDRWLAEAETARQRGD